jgi:hypothetical protein
MMPDLADCQLLASYEANYAVCGRLEPGNLPGVDHQAALGAREEWPIRQSSLCRDSL